MRRILKKTRSCKGQCTAEKYSPYPPVSPKVFICEVNVYFSALLQLFIHLLGRETKRLWEE